MGSQRDAGSLQYEGVDEWHGALEPVGVLPSRLVPPPGILGRPRGYGHQANQPRLCH